jgi:hypothetical protein
MLFQLLALLREGGTRRVTELAHELNTTPGLVEAMLDDLSQLGYLKQMNDQCSEKCAACPMAGSCAKGQEGSGQVWALVEPKSSEENS